MWKNYEQYVLTICVLSLVSFDSFSGDMVWLTDTGLNWTMATNNCSQYGMELLQPINESMMIQLGTLMNTTTQNHSIGEIWIGLKYDNPTHSYYWQDGSSLSQGFWKDDIEESEREKNLCVKVLVDTQLWDVENCSLYLPFVCQHDTDTDTLPNSPDVVVFRATDSPSVTPGMVDNESEDILLWQAKDDPVVYTVLVGVAVCLVSIIMGYLTWKYFLHAVFDRMTVSSVKDSTDENELLRMSFGVTSANDYTK